MSIHKRSTIQAMEKRNQDVEQLPQPDSAMSRFLLVLAAFLGKDRAWTPGGLSKT
jgi:hypothetical protein